MTANRLSEYVPWDVDVVELETGVDTELDGGNEVVVPAEEVEAWVAVDSGDDVGVEGCGAEVDG